MLINKLLSNNNYIIPKSTEPNYLTYLMDLNLYPIVVLYNNYSSYIIFLKLDKCGYSFNEISIKPLNIKDIKILLYKTKHITETVYGLNTNQLFITLPSIYVKKNIL